MNSITRLCVLLLLISSITPASADEESCPAPGITSRWVMAFCFARFETDDPAHPGVSACFLNERVTHDKAVSEDCETNLIYKAAFCSLRLERGLYDTPVSECVASPEVMPRVVSHGIG